MRSTTRAAIVAAAILTVAGIGSASAQVAVQPVREAYTVEPFAPVSEISIRGSGVRLRAEPFTTPDTAVLSHGSTGLPLTVVGIARRPDWVWYQVVLKSGQKAFIRSDFTSAPLKAETGPPAPSPSAPQLAAPLPAPNPVALGPGPSAPVITPGSIHAPAPFDPVQTPPSGGSAISLLPRSPLPSSASDNADGLISIGPP